MPPPAAGRGGGADSWEGRGHAAWQHSLVVLARHHRMALQPSAAVQPLPSVPGIPPPPSSIGGGAPGEADATRKGEGRPLSVRAGEECGTAADMAHRTVRW